MPRQAGGLSMSPGAIRQRERRARRKAEQSVADTEQLPLDDVPSIEVAPPAEKPRLSLKERLTQKVKQPAADHKKRAKKVDSNLITQLAPTLVATFVATYSRQMIRDPYKMCAPSQDEVLAMVAPYFNILSRYVEVTGHASENVLDLINAVLASIMYGTRAYVTYAMIKEDKTHESSSELVERRRAEYRAKLEQEAQEIATTYDSSTENNGPIGYSSVQSPNVEDGNANAQDGNSEYNRREADRVAVLLSRDVEGRRRLGLV